MNRIKEGYDRLPRGLKLCMILGAQTEILKDWIVPLNG